MAQTYTTKPGDMLDLICYRAYGGRQAGAVEKVLEVNFGLAAHLPILPPGKTIVLPELAQKKTAQTQKLWD